MLRTLQLGNFKAFGATQRLPIRPLTLIFGPNSAGKSSLIHGMLLGQHVAATGDLDAFHTEIGGESVDLGGFRQYIHRRDVTQHLEWGAELDLEKLTGRVAELLAPARLVRMMLTAGVELDDEGYPLEDAVPYILTYSIEVDGEPLLRMSRRPDDTLRIDRLHHEHLVLRTIALTNTTTEEVTEDDYVGLGTAIDVLLPSLTVEVGSFLPVGLLRKDMPTDLGDHLKSIVQGTRQETLARAVSVWLPSTLDDVIRGLTTALNTELERVRYLGPLRSYPPRHLAFSEHDDRNWRAGGGYAWDVVRKQPIVRKAVNHWLGAKDRLQTPYELVVRRFVPLAPVQEGIRDWLDTIYCYLVPEPVEETDEEFEARVAQGKYISFMDGLRARAGELVPFKKEWITHTWDEKWDTDRFAEAIADGISELEGPDELVLIDQRTNTLVSHRDIGIGISQVLPVLVTAYANRDSIVAIEQPEIHLHPALQAELGDVFIESALKEHGNTFILETHSEHLILRIMRRMRETAQETLPEGLPAVHPEDVAILYVQPRDGTTVVRVLELSEDGELLDPWPGGFFEEGFRERFS